jgi:hypothetical protein
MGYFTGYVTVANETDDDVVTHGKRSQEALRALPFPCVLVARWEEHNPDDDTDTDVLVYFETEAELTVSELSDALEKNASWPDRFPGVGDVTVVVAESIPDPRKN